MTGIVTLTMNPSLDIATSIAHVSDTIKLRCAPEESHPGGGGINVSRIIHNLGGDSIAVFPCGGYTGGRLQELLLQEDLTTHTIPINSNTRQSFSVHESTSGRDFRFLLPGHALSQDIAHTCLEYIRNLKSKPRFIVASGSLPPGLEDNFYAALSQLARTLDCLFVLDTSGPALAHALEAGDVYFFKPSLEELEELTGQSLDTEVLQLKAARRLIQAGKTSMVVISLAEEGVLLVSADFAIRASGIPVTPVSTVGAGDCVVGAMVWALERGLSLEQALRYGVASATATILNAHGEMGRKEDIERLIDKINITRL